MSRAVISIPPASSLPLRHFARDDLRDPFGFPLEQRVEVLAGKGTVVAAAWRQSKQRHDAGSSDNAGLNLFGAIGKKPQPRTGSLPGRLPSAGLVGGQCLYGPAGVARDRGARLRAPARN